MSPSNVKSVFLPVLNSVPGNGFKYCVLFIFTKVVSKSIPEYLYADDAVLLAEPVE
jgi:hypothetical protein